MSTEKTVVVLVDWENIFYTLERDYGITCQAQQCLKEIREKARKYGRIRQMDVFYGGHLQDEAFLAAMRFCSANARPLAPQTPGQPERGLADVYLLTEALCLFFEEKPDVVVIVAGDKGYTPMLQKIQERGKMAVVMGLQKSMARLFKESDFTRDSLVYLDELILETQRPPTRQRPKTMARIVSSHDARTPEQQEEGFEFDVRRLILIVMEVLAKTGFRHISLKKLTEIMGLSPADEEWHEWRGLIEKAVEADELAVTERKLKNNPNPVPHFRPNFEHEVVWTTLLYWSVLTGLIRQLTRKRDSIPLVSILDHLAPFTRGKNTSTEEADHEDNPRRELYKVIYSIGVERGAIVPDIVTNEEGRPATLVRLTPEHDLLKHPPRLEMPADMLPADIRADLDQLMTTLARLIDSSPPDRNIALARLFTHLDFRFPKHTITIAETIGLVDLFQDDGPRGFPVTFIKPAKLNK